MAYGIIVINTVNKKNDASGWLRIAKRSQVKGRSMAGNEHNWTISPVRRRICTHCGESLNSTAWDMASHWAREHGETDNGEAALELLPDVLLPDQVKR